MPDPVTEVNVRDDSVLVMVRKRALDEVSTKQLAQDVLVAAAQTPRLPIVLDMSQVRFAPSVALGELVQLSKSFRLDGRRLALIRVERNVLGSIQVTNLHNVLEIHDTLEQVVARK